MTPCVVSGTRSRYLAEAIGRHLGVDPVSCHVERFPDGELRPRLGPVRGADVYLVQSTAPPVSESLVELLLLLDACRRGGAAAVTAVVPYFGYARQDRRTAAGEAVGARAVADALAAEGAQRLIVVDPHTPALEAMFPVPVEMLTAVPILAAALAEKQEETVVVAPDLGAVKLAERIAARLDADVAVVRKTRVTGASVRASQLVGEVAGRQVLIVDDMISTGATIEAAVQLLLGAGACAGMRVAATHGPLVPEAVARLRVLPVRSLVVTDSCASPVARPASWIDLRSIAPLLGDAIQRIHHGDPLDELLLRA